MKTAELLFDILRSEINGELIQPDVYRDYDPKQLYTLAKSHDLMYCVTDALDKVGLLPKDEPACSAYVKEQMIAVARIARIENALAEIKQILSDAKIPFVPLKGALLRRMYPDEMMRASCDIDILVKEEHLDMAVSALVSRGFETDGKRAYHDISLYYGQVHLELHFNICEDMEDIDILLNRVWEYVTPVSPYEYHEIPVFFVYHHIAHMKYHFINGGCGIRPFLDLYVMRKNNFYDEDELLKFLDTVGLRTFYGAILSVIQVWFAGEPHSELTRKCEEYILRGGVYGTLENGTAVQSSIKKGKFNHIWHAVFPKYSSMCIIYPSLKRRKILLPLYYIKRIAEKTFRKDAGKTRHKLKKIITQDQNQINSIGDLLTAVGLKGNR